MSPSARPPLAAVLAVATWMAAVLVPPGSPAAAMLLLGAAFLPAGLRLFEDRLGTRRVPWAPWLAAAAPASLVAGWGGVLTALPVAVAAAAGAHLAPRATGLVVGALLLAELTAGLRLGSGANLLAGHLSGIVLAALATAFLVARLRSEVERLGHRLSLATGRLELEEDEVEPDDREAGRALSVRRPAERGRGDLDALLELTRRALRARTAVLYERLLDPPSWRVAAGASEATDFDSLATAPLGHGLVAWAARHEMPFRISEPGPQLRSIPHYSGDSATGSFLALPLASFEAADEGGALMVLAVDSPHPRRFEEGGEELLALHASVLGDRLHLGARMALWRQDRAAAASLPAAVEATIEGRTAERLLAEAVRLGKASAGAVLWFDARTPQGGPGPAAERGRGALLLASSGLELSSGHRLEPGEESWSTWVAAHPGHRVLLAAYHADRGMPRICRGDGLDAAWSFMAEALGTAGALALAWPERHLPGQAVLDSLRVLAAAGACTLLREEAMARLAAGRRLDGLTGLPGRSEFLLAGPRACEEAAREGGRLGLLLFDLDGSSRILREAGPEAWDAAVETLSRSLSAALPAAARLYRWGADEFAALLPGAGDEGVGVAARRACAAAAQAQVAGRAASASAGHACFRSHREDFEGLLARAGQAIAAAREAGDGRVVAAQEPPA